MATKVQLRLLASSEMSERGENDLIRFPRRARDAFGFSNNQVVIGKGEYEISLRAKRAYKADIQRLASLLRAGKLTDDDAAKAGFVTRSTQQRLSQREGRNVWITGGVSNITIGCDPEFGLIDDDGRLCRGTAVLPGSKASKFGADGPGVEVRPSPARSHLSVVRGIKGILDKPPSRADGYKWVGGATYEDTARTYWFGGHIHLGRPEALPGEQAQDCYQKVATALDHLVALPLVSFDTPLAHKRRLGCDYQYGLAGEGAHRRIEIEEDRFEYRVLSGLWLTHPTLAKVILGVTKCVTESAYQRAANQNWDPDWIEAPLSRGGLLKSLGLKNSKAVAEIINRGRPQGLKAEHIKAWEGQLRKLEAYDQYSEEIKALVEIVRASPEEVVPRLILDIRKNWQEKRPLLPKAGARIKRALERVEEKG